MNIDHVAITLFMVLALGGCNKTSEPPKPVTAPAATSATPSEYTTTPAADAAKTDAKAEAKPDVPDTHGMPGMADLFKDDKAKEGAKN